MKLAAILVVLCVFPRVFQCVPVQQIPWGVPQRRTVDLLVGGFIAKAQDFPWHASMFHKIGRTWEYQCAGSLISERFVLTAKHCTLEGDDPMPVDRILIKFGLQKYTKENRNSQKRAALQVYRASGNLWEGFRNDIALIKLSEEVAITEHVLPVLLVEEEPPARTMGTVVGFGYTEESGPSEPLRQLEMPVIDSRQCTFRHANYKLDLGQFCAGHSDNKTACNGDSGGGLVFRKGRTFYLGGIVSYSEKQIESNACRFDGYSVFTSVHNYLPWIRRITKLNLSSTEPNNVPCGVSKIQRFRRVVRGQETVPGQWPWHVNIYHDVEDNYTYQCGGVLINERFILTLEMCVRDHGRGKILNIFVKLGITRLDEANREYYKVKIVHSPEGDEYASDNNKIALLQLPEDVAIFYTDIVRPVCLPVSDIEYGEYGTAIGFGYMEKREIPNILRMASMPTMNATYCFRKLEIHEVLKQDNFCAGYTNGTNVCNGDSGGGFYVKDGNDAWYISGLTSFTAVDENTYTCAEYKPTVFKNVFMYLSWIKSVMLLNS